MQFFSFIYHKFFKKDFEPPQIVFKTFYTPASLLPLQYLSNLMTAPLGHRNLNKSAIGNVLRLAQNATVHCFGYLPLCLLIFAAENES